MGKVNHASVLNVRLLGSRKKSNLSKCWVSNLYINRFDEQTKTFPNSTDKKIENSKINIWRNQHNNSS